MGSDERTRGLPSLKRQAEVRWRAIAQGRVGMRDAQPQFWLWTIVGFAAFGVVYWYFAERELEKQKSAVMARQRAYAQELGVKLIPLRDKFEAWVVELSGEMPKEFISPHLSLDKLTKSKGVYLRVRLRSATSAEEIRQAAQHSLHDGFTSCLFQREGRFSAPGEKPQCLLSSDCSAGELCNEWNVCAQPSQPFNLRLMYRAMRVLSPEWTDELHEASDDYQVRIFERDLEKVTRTDVPVAADLLTSAKYFTVVIDEDPPRGLPKVGGMNRDGGVSETVATQLQTVPHPVRLGIWDVRSGEPLVRMRTIAGADFVPVGRLASVSLKTLRAQQRQVNNCSIAQELRDRVREREEAAAAPANVAPTLAVPRAQGEVGSEAP